MSEPTPVEPATPQTPSQPEPTPAIEPAQAPVKSWVNDDGSWNRDRFGDDLGGHSIFDKYQNVEELVKGTINSQKMIGQKVDDWLGSDNEEVVKQRMKLSGVPETADDYEITFPEAFGGLPEESQGAIQEYFKDSAQWAHENGVSKDVYEKFAARDLTRAIEVYNEQQRAQDVAFTEADDALKARWKNHYDENTEKSNNMAKFLGLDDLIPIMEANPVLRENFFENASKITSDDTIIEAKQKQSVATVSERLDELDDKMLSYDGPTGDSVYKRWLSEKVQLLDQLQ